MTLLRSGDSINFQKASYTLDGCVKVYTSRIDSVDSETRKLLLGLVDNKVEQNEADTVEQTATKRRKQNAKTLTDNASLSMETLEMDFAADPLFQKTAADFDEGGAKGLLLSHLDISNAGRIIFDATDFQSESEVLNMDTEIDIAGLQAKFGSKLSNLHSQVVCPTFASFQFNSDEVNEEFKMNINREEFIYEPMDVDDVSSDEEDQPRFEMQDDNSPFQDFQDTPQFETHETSKEIFEQNIMKMVERTVFKGEDSMFAYFDKTSNGNWAGPEFWKARLRKMPTEKAAKAPAKRKEKKFIDFINTRPMDTKILFARTKASTILPKPKIAEHHLLPLDMKYNSEKLSRMFMKPSFTVF